MCVFTHSYPLGQRVELVPEAVPARDVVAIVGQLVVVLRSHVNGYHHLCTFSCEYVSYRCVYMCAINVTSAQVSKCYQVAY